MTLESNKALTKKAIQIWSNGNVAQVNELFAPNYINHQHHHPNQKQDLSGIEAWKKFIQEFRQAFPDFHDTIEDQIAEGNKVATRFTSQGTHKGRWMGIDPTNKKVTWTGICIDRVENGKIVESWVDWDLHGILEQLGVLHATR